VGGAIKEGAIGVEKEKGKRGALKQRIKTNDNLKRPQ